MFRKMLFGLVGAFAALAATFGAPEAKAQGFGVSVGFGGPGYYGGYRPYGYGYRPIGYRYGGYYGPRRVVRRVVVTRPYYAPRRVVYSRPVYYAPRRVVYNRPIYRRVYVNRPVYYAPRRVVRRVYY